jgi:uncharacterized protein YcfJ
VAGNRIGKRRHRGALTIAGTVIGAALGRGVSRDSRRYRRDYRQTQSYFTTERHCETRTEYHDEERIDGYDVTYRYHGRDFTTRTDSEPGRHIRVRVQVEPTLDYDKVTGGERWYRSRASNCGDACADTWM